MLPVAVWLATAVAAAGATLAARMLIDEDWPRWASRLGVAHGAAGLGATILALLSLGGAARGVREGAANFGLFAAAFLAVALVLGATLYVVQRRRRAPAPLIVAIHGSLGIAGAVLLAAWWSMPPS